MPAMLAYVLRRVFQSLLVLLVVGLVAFAMFRYVGDPVENMLGQERTQADIERLRQQLGLDQPFPVQYLRFLEQAVQGNFGLSYRQGRPVSEILVERLPATLELAFVSGVLALVGGIGLGVFTAIRRRGWAANAIMTLSLIGVSLPTFLIGILLIYLFSVELGWLPSFGRGDVVDLGWWSTGFLTASGLKALILPAITLGLYQMTLIMRLVRTEMLEVLRADYIRFARARGLRERAINFRHALKNTMVPVITITGLQLGSIIAFAIITETVFQWPGVGLSVHQRDPVRRYPGDGGLSDADLGDVRRHQPDRRSAVLRHRPAVAGRSRHGGQRMTDMADKPAAAAPARPGRLRAAWRQRFPGLFVPPVADCVVSFCVVVVLVLAALLAPLIAPHDPFDPGTLNLMNGFTPPMTPNAFTGDSFWLGTDDQGRDVFSTILYGMRISLFVGFSAVLLAMVIGVTLGLFAGYVGGWLETLIMRIADVQLTFPRSWWRC
jgi:peptide/nickel transport system permease protein